MAPETATQNFSMLSCLPTASALPLMEEIGLRHVRLQLCDQATSILRPCGRGDRGTRLASDIIDSATRGMAGKILVRSELGFREGVFLARRL